MKSIWKSLIIFVLILTVSIGYSSDAVAAQIMWGKTELKSGQIGKVTILSDTTSHELDINNNLKHGRVLKKGEEYRVYSYRGDIYGGAYGLGGGIYILKYSAIKYETPSKTKLALLAQQNDTILNGMWGKIKLNDGYNAKVVIIKPTYLYSHGSRYRLLNPGEEYRIHGSSSEPWKIDLGASTYVEKKDVEIKEIWMFDNMEWKIGQQGKLIILQPTTLVKFDAITGKLVKARDLYIGEQYRVYGLSSLDSDLYDVGAGYYVTSDVNVKYETLSKAFLDSIENRFVK